MLWPVDETGEEATGGGMTASAKDAAEACGERFVTEAAGHDGPDGEVDADADADADGLGKVSTNPLDGTGLVRNADAESEPALSVAVAWTGETDGRTVPTAGNLADTGVAARGVVDISGPGGVSNREPSTAEMSRLSTEINNRG